MLKNNLFACLFMIFSMLGSAVFVLVGLIASLWAAVALENVFGLKLENPDGPRTVVMAISGILLLMIASKLFFELPARLLDRGQYPTEEALRKAGQLYSRAYSITRAMEVEEQEDEGPTFILALEPGGTLFLSGQYLYDYQQLEEDGEMRQPGKFPCTHFTLWRRKFYDYVTSIECRGEFLAPERILPPLTHAQFDANLVPNDGEVLERSIDDFVEHLTSSNNFT